MAGGHLWSYILDNIYHMYNQETVGLNVATPFEIHPFNCLKFVVVVVVVVVVVAVVVVVVSGFTVCKITEVTLFQGF